MKKLKTFTDKEKEEYLLKIIKTAYSQGDDFHAYKTKKGKWEFGYTNDYPMQHGNGVTVQLPDEIVSALMNV